MTLDIARSVKSSPIDPQWTEVGFPSSGGRDALGIETLSEAILVDLLPGINNQTGRARYYSFWAWVLRDFINDAQAEHTQSGYYDWLRKREDLLILSYLAHGCSGGAAGVDQGGKIWQEGEQAAYPLTWKSLLSVNGGAYQLYYRGPLVEMNIVSVPDDERSHDALTRTIGASLADAYAESVSDTAYVQRYLDASRVTRSILDDYAEKGCLCQVDRHENERQALIHAFFRFDTPDANAVRRLSSLCLFLDIIQQSQGQPLTSDRFRDVLYYWRYDQDHVYEPQGNLLAPAQRWRLFQLRQWFVFAIEAPWSLFLSRIEIESLTEAAYLGELLDQLDLAALADRLGILLPDNNIHTLTVQAFYTAIQNAMSDAGQTSGSREVALNERDLGASIRARQNAGDPLIMLGYALVMMGMTYWRVQPWIGQPGWMFHTDRYAAGRMPMESYLRHVEQAWQEGWSLARWICWLHQRYLWQQHRRVVLQKLAGGGKDTSKFEYLDEQEDANQRFARMRATSQDAPKMNAPRFPSALGILTDLALIEPLPNVPIAAKNTKRSAFHWCDYGVSRFRIRR